MDKQRIEIKADDPLRTKFAGARVCQHCSLILDGAGGTERCPVDQSSLMVVPDNPFADDDEIGKQYEIVSVLGSGGWGLVFRARQISLDRFVAIKMLHPHYVAFPERMERFRREAEAVSKLNHPNIMTIYDFGVLRNGQPYLVLEYIEGLNLNTLLEADKPLSVERALPIFEQICDGLYVAHEKGVVHRDLKPENIRLADNAAGVPLVKIMDFGLARITDESDLPDRLTRSGATVGTPAYMSPEQCLGHAADARTDIYSLGCVMFEVLTGKPPVSGSSLYEMMHKHVNDALPPLNEAGARVPAYLEKAVEWALTKDRDKRPQTALELKKALIGDIPERRPPAPRSIRHGDFHFVYIGLLLAIGLVACVFLVKLPASVPRAVAPNMVAHPHADKSPAGVSQSLITPGRRQFLNAMLLTRYINRELELANSGISDSDVGYICNEILSRHMRVEGINLNDNPISDAALDHLGKLKGVWGMTFVRDQVTDAGIAKLRNAGLSRLSVQHTPVTGSCFDSGFERLGELYMEEASFNPKNLPTVVQLPSLECLQLNGTSVHDADLAAFDRPNMPLVELHLGDTDVTDRGLVHLRLLRLRTLLLWGSIVHGQGLSYIQPDKLENLWISNCSDETLVKITRFRHLKTLEVYTSQDFSPNGLPALQKLTQLETLLVQGRGGSADAFNDDCMQALRHLLTVRNLTVVSDAVTDAGADQLKGMRLNKLVLRCPGVSQAEIEKLRKAMPNCLVTTKPN